MAMPRQFSVRRLFAVTTCIAVAFGLYHWLGMEPTAAILFVVACAVGGYFVKPYIFDCPVCNIVVFGLLSSMLLGGVLSLRPRTRGPRPLRYICHGNLHQVALALRSYADVHGAFPPAYIADAKGRPMHSWRVLILPYMERKDVYELYDFSEPWNGPHNRLLANTVSYSFQCPADSSMRGTANTSYLAITGPQTIWPGNGALSVDEISDGVDRTLAVVEVANSGIHWMEPRDLPFSALDLGVNSPQAGDVSSTHSGYAHGAFCEGFVRKLKSTISVGDLKVLATKSGDEKIDEEY